MSPNTLKTHLRNIYQSCPTSDSGGAPPTFTTTVGEGAFGDESLDIRRASDGIGRAANHFFRECHVEQLSAQALRRGNLLGSKVAAWSIVLMHNVQTCFYNTTYPATGAAEHLTVDVANTFNGSSLISLSLTNSLLVGVSGSYGSYSGAYTQTAPSGSTVFQSVGGGNHYLAVGSPYRNVGTTNINYQLLSELGRTTTYPPVKLTSDITSSVTLGPQVQRDADIPDLGYHYAPLDYLISGLNVNGATLTLTNGAAVGVHGNIGLELRSGGALVSEGAPTRLNRLVRYQAVQELPLLPQVAGSALVNVAARYATRPSLTFSLRRSRRTLRLVDSRRA